MLISRRASSAYAFAVVRPPDADRTSPLSAMKGLRRRAAAASLENSRFDFGRFFGGGKKISARSIAAVAEEMGLQQSVLRFWEGRFPTIIRPTRVKGGHRRYRAEDVEALKGLRELLYRQGFTLEGARQVIGSRGTGYLRALGRGESVPDPDTVLAGHAIASLSTEQQQDLSRALADPDACRVLAAAASRYPAGADQVGHRHG